MNWVYLKISWFNFGVSIWSTWNIMVYPYDLPELWSGSAWSAKSFMSQNTQRIHLTIPSQVNAAWLCSQCSPCSNQPYHQPDWVCYCTTYIPLYHILVWLIVNLLFHGFSITCSTWVIWFSLQFEAFSCCRIPLPRNRQGTDLCILSESVPLQIKYMYSDLNIPGEQLFMVSNISPIMFSFSHHMNQDTISGRHESWIHPKKAMGSSYFRHLITTQNIISSWFQQT